MNDNDYVYVDGHPALGYPNFIIQREGKLYVTLAVLEYDPDAPDLTPEQQECIADLMRVFGGAAEVAARDVETRLGISCQSTNPPAED